MLERCWGCGCASALYIANACAWADFAITSSTIISSEQHAHLHCLWSNIQIANSRLHFEVRPIIGTHACSMHNCTASTSRQAGRQADGQTDRQSIRETAMVVTCMACWNMMSLKMSSMKFLVGPSSLLSSNSTTGLQHSMNHSS